MATLKELSDRTGYSPATISRILTGDSALAVTPEARQKVLEEAGRLNYAATKSNRGRTPKKLLHIAVAEALTPAQRLNDPYYLYLRNYVEEACRESRYAFLPLEREGSAFLPPQGPPPDGLLALGIFLPAQIDTLRRISPRLLFVDSSPDELHSDSVVLNFRLGMEQAVDYLFAQGHTAIGFVGPAQKLDDHGVLAPEARRRHFAERMAHHGCNAPLFIECPMDARETTRALGEFLQTAAPQPTALLCANEENAIGALRAIGAAGLHVPDDISLISFNDTPLSELIDPPLTSISTHVREMANTAVRLLAERCAGIRTLPQKVVVPPTLVLRQSVLPQSI